MGETTLITGGAGFLGAHLTHALVLRGDRVVVYRRQSTPDHQIAMVFLNFSDGLQSIAVPFPEPGSYREMIDDGLRATPFEISVSSADQVINVEVPSNYGYIFIYHKAIDVN